MEKKRTKTGGRQKGSPNKITMDLRMLYKEFLEKQSSKLDQLFDSIEDPSKKFDILIKLSEYTIPKLQRTEVKSNNKNIDFDVPTEKLREVLKYLENQQEQVS